MPSKKIKFKPNRRLVAVLAFALGLAGLLYYSKSWLVVAWVNGRPVSRMAYVAELQKLAKNQAMDSLLTKQLIIQEAAKNSISVNAQEIDEAINQIEEQTKAQGTSLDELLAAQGVSRDSLHEEVRINKLVDKLVGDITVPDEKIKSYYDDNQQTLYPDKSFDEVKAEISDQLKQGQLINKIQELIARLQSEAKIIKWLK